MVTITRRETFNAAHRLYVADWSAEKNWEAFGPCSRIHGHNWELFVTIKGEVNPVTGLIIDFKVISRVVKEHIISKVDHTFLNEDVDFMRGIMPSTENFIIEIAKILTPIFRNEYGVEIHHLKLTETANHYAEYFAEN